jgi:hypothetical protein
MKIRINGPSIRLRLSQTEVDQICSQGKVTTICPVGDQRLSYSLAIDQSDRMHANIQHGNITVYVPQNLITGWATDQRVGFDDTTKDGLYLLIEKDFQCLKPRPHEDESDLYINPNAGESC